MAILEVKHIEKHFGAVQVLKDISFNLEKGKTLGAFLIYVAVGVVGFGLTELLTLLGTGLIGHEGIWYLLLSCFVKGIVLIWNYVGRKILVYKGK